MLARDNFNFAYVYILLQKDSPYRDLISQGYCSRCGLSQFSLTTEINSDILLIFLEPIKLVKAVYWICGRSGSYRQQNNARRVFLKSPKTTVWLWRIYLAPLSSSSLDTLWGWLRLSWKSLCFTAATKENILTLNHIQQPKTESYIDSLHS